MAAYNFADMFELAADKVPDRMALIDDRRRVTFRELDERSTALAHSFADAGVNPGDHVGIYATNCIEWVEAMVGLYKARAVPINVNFRYVADELRYLFDNADLVGLVYQRAYGPLIAEARAAEPKLTHFTRIEDGTDADDAALEPVEFEAAIAAASTERDFGERSGDDIYLLYTGGTTGMPKGVMWRQEDVFFALGGGIDAFTNERVTSPSELSDRIDTDAPDGLRMFPIPPLMHGAGQFGVLRCLTDGSTAVLTESFDPERVWRIISAEKVNSIMVTGDAMARPLAETLERLISEEDIDVSSVVSFSSTAAIWSQTVKEHMQRLLPEYVVMTDSIGSTESGMNGFRQVERGAVQAEGITTVMRSADSEVLNDDLEPVTPGSGEVGFVARGGNIPIGYYNDPEKTAETFVTDKAGKRWSIPGDYAKVEADDRITLLGRGSVSINSGGEKIYPEEVEGTIKAHPEVYDVLVVGVPDDRWGERVTAVIQARKGSAPTRDSISEHCRTHIAGYKVPREVFLVDEVPRLPNGKPDYRAAKEIALSLTGSPS